MGIRVVVPYTDLNPATAAAVPDADFISVPGPDSYRFLLRDLWEQGDPFILVEHDVVPTDAQLAALEDCEQPWCHFGYCPGDWVPTFGCVRFSAELIAGTRGVWENEWPWCQLDAKFQVYARELGWKHHWHYPHVLHTRFSIVEGGLERREPLDREQELGILRAEMESLRAASRPTATAGSAR